VFNAIYGVAWLAGSSAMGLLYDRSVGALVGMGVAAQFASAVLFVSMRRALAEARLRRGMP
jgi:hypothetical protein